MAQNSSTNPATGGNTSIPGSGSADQLSGGGGNDTITGLAGNDRLSGDAPLPGQWQYSVYDRNFADAPNQTSLIGDTQSTLIGHGYVDDFNAEDLRNTLGGTPTTLGRNDFGVIYRSGLQITTGGNYTFSTRSDDGSRIIIKDANGVEVFNLNNDDDQGATTVTKSVVLQPGLYSIEVFFWENAGVTAMSGTIAGPGLPQADLATSPLITTPPLAPGHVDGDDSIVGDSGNDTITGGGGNDRLFGGANSDSILGEDGRDFIDGGTGSDVIDGGADNDTVDGGGAGDTIQGGGGDDSIFGNSGADSVAGGAGDDTLLGGDDGDSLFGDGDDDQLFGGSGADSLYGGTGDDSLNGETGDDLLFGDAGNDTLLGEAGADQLDGGANDDLLDGGGGVDGITGGTGNDSISGGAEDDILSGDAGNDVFGYVVGDVSSDPTLEFVFGGGDPNESISSDNDILDLSAFGATYGWASVVIAYAADPEDGIVKLYAGIPAPDDSNLLGSIRFEDIERIIRCFTPGTMILTDRGEVPVEALVAGDLVMTRDHGLQPLRWAGRQHISRARLLADPDLQPVRIAAGALGGAGPVRSMVVSPQHRVLVAGARAELLFGEDEVLVPAKHLIGHAEVTLALPEDGVAYIHILFDRHEIVQSDGIWTESFQPAARTLTAMEAEARAEILKIFPGLATDAGAYDGARPTLKAHEARVLFAG